MNSTSTGARDEFRKLPSMNALLDEPEIALLATQQGRRAAIDALRALLDDARRAIADGDCAPDAQSWPARLAQRLDADSRPSLRPVINASGIIVHTNLGRAPLSADARRAINSVTSGYSNLEYSLADGQRGSRHVHARALLCELTGAEDALVVNNAAAALYFALTALCRGRGVLVSRGELVEIGGGFRIPDILRQSGAYLIEVGTTNRTHPRDFANAIDDETAALLRVHTSNFRQIGFTTAPPLEALVDLVQRARQLRVDGAPANLSQSRYAALRDAQPDASHNDSESLLVIDDVGSGALLDLTRFDLAAEPLVSESVASGADLTIFSGDKLLGGPQAGILVGRRAVIEALRHHPLARALRVDKLTLAALEATLHSYRRGQALHQIPVWQMISAPVDLLTARATRWRDALVAHGIDAAALAVIEGQSAVGGGSLPGETLPTALLALTVDHLDKVSTHLRTLDTPIVARISDSRLCFDPRTVLPEQEEALLRGIEKIVRGA